MFTISFCLFDKLVETFAKTKTCKWRWQGLKSGCLLYQELAINLVKHLPECVGISVICQIVGAFEIFTRVIWYHY